MRRTMICLYEGQKEMRGYRTLIIKTLEYLTNAWTKAIFLKKGELFTIIYTFCILEYLMKFPVFLIP